MRFGLPIALLVLLLPSATNLHAQGKDKPLPMPKTDPDLDFKIVAKTDVYKVPSEWRGGKLQARIAVDDFPKPPVVDLELQIANKGKSDKTLLLDSDGGRLELVLNGPGAVSAAALRVFTQEFRRGKLVTIKPGETHTIAWRKLTYGHRGVEFSAYWTEPGDYTLSGKLILPFDPKEPSAEKLELTAKAIKIKIEAE
jgi:hypothetical protein